MTTRFRTASFVVASVLASVLGVSLGSSIAHAEAQEGGKGTIGIVCVDGEGTEHTWHSIQSMPEAVRPHYEEAFRTCLNENLNTIDERDLVNVRPQVVQGLDVLHKALETKRILLRRNKLKRSQRPAG